MSASFLFAASERQSAGYGGYGRLIRSLMLFVALTLGAHAFAADDEKVFTPGASRTEAVSNPAGSTFNSMSLILGVALAGAGAWMVWRNRRGTPVGREARALAIEETRSLGNRQFLVVASYEGKKFLIGVCPGRIEMLSALDGASSQQKVGE